MAAVDPRIAFVTEARPEPGPGGVLRLRAGTALEPSALVWFRFGARLASPAAAYSDHDHAWAEWHGRRHHHDPVLQPPFDPFWFAGGASSPALVYVADDSVAAAAWDERPGDLLCSIGRSGGRVLHVPRLLATIVNVDAGAATAPPDPPAGSPAPVGEVPRGEMRASARPENIAVVIPTRDQAALLERCVETLVAQARHPERLEIIVVDNRSTEAATEVALRRLAVAHGVRVLPLDEPFNWSRANNLAIRASRAPLLLCLNNDTEMLTRHWDDILEAHLADPAVGLVGARLLYPDRTVQHAGILFGMDDAAPAHEGVGAAEDDGGPDGRWLRPRSAAAVTGAFMAMRRETWEATGGFDELSFPVGYNDVDMCLKVRTCGGRVLYAPDLLLIHHESKTRGFNVTRSQVAWDLAELRALHARWGDLLFRDVGLNPHWNRHGTPFGGYRDPPLSEIVDYMSAEVRCAAAARGPTPGS